MSRLFFLLDYFCENKSLTYDYAYCIFNAMKLNKRKIELELERLGWSKRRLAEEMGVKRQWVYVVLSDARDGCTLRTVNRIAKALGLNPRDLLT